MSAVLAPEPREPVSPGRQPSFSVIIAAYQAAEFVGDAIRSALDQTLPPFEVIVCDDGSTDGTDRVVESFDRPVRLVRRGNGGEGAAKDTAARAAEGDFVVLLDADDLWLPSRLAALAELAGSRPDLDILTTDAWMVAGERRVGRVYHEGWRFAVSDQPLAILERNFVFGGAAVRREALLAAGGFDPAARWTADWECWIRMIVAGARVGLDDRPLALYRLHEGALSSNRARLLRGRVRTLEKARRLALDARERAALERSIDHHDRAALVEEARQAARLREADARRLSWEVARDRRFDSVTRLKAAAAALSPMIAARLLARRERGRWVGAGGTTIERD